MNISAKLVAISTLLVFGVMGCAKIRIDEDSAYYSAWGKREVQELSFTKTGDSVTLSVGSAKGDSGRLTEALKDIGKIATGAVIPVKP
jgi:hypothetical protein